MAENLALYPCATYPETFIQDESLAELHDYFKDYINAADPEAYVCLYGSSMYKPTSRMSDVDMFIATSRFETSDNDVEKLADFIEDFHLRNGRKVDEEVPYSNKIVYNPQERQDAISLAMFPDGRVTPIQKTPEYLNGPEIKRRLFLNALTTPHYIISVKEQNYQTEKLAAERALTLLGVSLQSDYGFSIDDLYSSLCVGPNGEFGENHLGYKINYPRVGRYLINLLQRTVPLLAEQNIIEGDEPAVLHKVDTTLSLEDYLKN